MSLIVLPFVSDESRTQGDSSITPDMVVPYVEGMTVAQLEHAVLLKLSDNDTEASIEELREDLLGVGVDGEVATICGGFVIEQSDYDDIVDIDFDANNDSAVYRMVNMLKQQIEKKAVKVIE